ncbi:MAG: hypothetical protein IKJ52_04620 [Muribaculaceae bacterium]|nr:hypothetical protein [Muribaculaceae bacterium]
MNKLLFLIIFFIGVSYNAKSQNCTDEYFMHYIDKISNVLSTTDSSFAICEVSLGSDFDEFVYVSSTLMPKCEIAKHRYNFSPINLINLINNYIFYKSRITQNSFNRSLHEFKNHSEENSDSLATSYFNENLSLISQALNYDDGIRCLYHSTHVKKVNSDKSIEYIDITDFIDIVSILSGTDIHFTENQSLNKIIYQQLNNWYTSCASKIRWDNILEIRKIMKKHSEKYFNGQPLDLEDIENDNSFEDELKKYIIN